MEQWDSEGKLGRFQRLMPKVFRIRRKQMVYLDELQGDGRPETFGMMY